MPIMPTNVEMNQHPGLKGAAGHTQTAAKQMVSAEQQGRLQRGAQILDNCRVDHWEECEFTESEAAGGLTDWIDFGQIHFTAKPGFSSGSQLVGQPDDSPGISPDYSNYDPDKHFRVPAIAAVAAWKQDSRGYYTGAKLMFWALGSVPDGYKILISATWVGPAVRMGG